MIRRLYEILPGPALVRFLLVVVGGAVVVTLLLLGYEWVGRSLFDGGGVG